MILSSGCPADEVERQHLNLRFEAFATIPDRIDLWEMVYDLTLHAGFPCGDEHAAINISSGEWVDKK